ncbi:MAG TPA: MarR family transcriptional regulator [Gemmatimonadales bacterium]|nr:MarR family transcriptional regulator [Gemmatimonadales bacterium]
MDRQTEQFIENMGLVLESDGLPRIAGRIFGLLLVSEEPRSLDDLAAELGVSKASVSTNARLLEHRGVLEQVSRPADRRDYYQVPHDLFSHTMAQRLARWQRFHETIGAARTILPIRSPEVRERLEEYEQAYAYMSRVISEALGRWQTMREKRMSRAGVPG